MLQKSREERYLRLDKMTNTRDLGGYETQSGTYTKMNCFIRASSPSNGTSEDLTKLKQLGITCTIDLRSAYECSQQPSPFLNDQEITYYHRPLLQDPKMNVLPSDLTNYNDLSGFYIYLLESNKKEMKEIFELFLQHEYETILFHCSAGKDRTGIIAALLLDVAGCHHYDIVKDYSESYENNEQVNEEIEAMIGSENAEFLSSHPRYMMKMLGYLAETYGSTKGYLFACGMRDQQIEEIVENFTF